MSKRITVLFILILTLFLVACGGSDSDGSSDKMQVYVSGDKVEGSAVTKMAEKYTEETGQEIEVVDIPYSDMETKITNMIRSGNPPPVARVTGFNPAWNGQLMDLTDIAEEHNVDKEMGVTVDDELVAPPLDLTAVGMFINKDLFEEADVSYPTSEDDIWTWDEFISAIETVIDKTDAEYGMVMDDSEHRLKAFIYQHGSKGFYEEDGAYTTNAETKDALQKFVDLNDDIFMPKSVWTAGEDPASMFKSGLIPAYMSGSWQITDFASNIEDFEWEAVYMPTDKVRATNLGGNYLVGFEGSGQEEEAKEFIDWLYTKENYEELATYGGYLPVTTDAEVDYELAPEVYDLYRNEIDNSDGISSVQRNESVKKGLVSKGSADSVLAEEIMKTINGEQELEKAIENVEKEMEEAYLD